MMKVLLRISVVLRRNEEKESRREVKNRHDVRTYLLLRIYTTCTRLVNQYVYLYSYIIYIYI